ncbi:hypothetical protein [Pseudanabaena sp. PCC 6802]|uniref:hypothetical protein n=1 Tax=Pseudanabaena sp. PCC 6802 TaxID=118173 RepID=UPI00034CC074|nr:hypothetical protein [Pseudanabaena sp. PCC 6802]
MTENKERDRSANLDNFASDRWLTENKERDRLTCIYSRRQIYQDRGCGGCAPMQG